MSRRLRIGVALLVTLVVVLAAGFPVYVDPQVDRLRKADAILVLGGYGYERYSEGIELALAGYADTVVFSNPDGAADQWLTDLCSHRRYPFTVRCFQPEPGTTRGEARELADLARENNWHSVIAVTMRPHISRARYVLQRCYSGDLMMTESPADLGATYWAWSYVYQTAGYVRAALQDGC